jgi:hypothetical protein
MPVTESTVEREFAHFEDCDLVLGRKVQKKAVSEGSVGPRRNNAFAFFCTDFGSSSRTLKENS